MGFISIVVVIFLGWSAVLWLVLPFDIFRYSLTSIIALHLAVPAIIVSGWALGRRWIDTARQKKAAALEASRRDIREAERARQKYLFDESLKARRVSVDCRWAVTADVIFHCGNKLFPADTHQTANYFYTPPSHAQSSWPGNVLIELLDDLFSAVPGAMTLPIAVCGNFASAGMEGKALIGNIRRAALARQAEEYSNFAAGEILEMPADSRSIYSAASDMLLRHSDWPALVMIAFDNVISAQPQTSCFDTSDTSISETEKWQGKAGRGISMLLLSQTGLIDALSKLDELAENTAIDDLSPYWEKQKIPVGMAAHLTRWSKAWRDNFASIQPIATLHRTEFVVLPDKEPMASRARKIEAAIVETAISASLHEPHFVFEDEVESTAVPSEHPIGETGWLFHNAGDIGYCGDRVAAMSLALWQAGIELNPVDQANNIVMALGDCGVATRYLTLALAIQRAAETGRPVLCMEWKKNGELAAGFIKPATDFIKATADFIKSPI